MSPHFQTIFIRDQFQPIEADDKAIPPLELQVLLSENTLLIQFPQLSQAGAEGEIETMLGIDFFNQEIHVLLNNPDYPDNPRKIWLGKLEQPPESRESDHFL